MVLHQQRDQKIPTQLVKNGAFVEQTMQHWEVLTKC